MPQHKSCKKRLLQAEKANAMNRSTRSAIRASAVSHRAGFCANRAANYKAKVAKVINGLA